jgi:hypothetical protein
MEKNRNQFPVTAMKTAPIVLVVVAILFLLAPRFAISGDRTIAVVASQIRWGIDIQRIKCLSLNRRIANRILGTDYSDDPNVLNVLKRYFPNKNVSLDDPRCPYVLTFNIFRHKIHAVRYLAQNARVLASFDVSKRSDIAKGMPTKTRSDKNVYLFRDDLAPLEVFEIGLKVFLAPQERDVQTLKVAVPTHT